MSGTYPMAGRPVPRIGYGMRRLAIRAADLGEPAASPGRPAGGGAGRSVSADLAGPGETVRTTADAAVARNIGKPWRGAAVLGHQRGRHAAVGDLGAELRHEVLQRPLLVRRRGVAQPRRDSRYRCQTGHERLSAEDRPG